VNSSIRQFIKRSIRIRQLVDYSTFPNVSSSRVRILRTPTPTPPQTTTQHYNPPPTKMTDNATTTSQSQASFLPNRQKLTCDMASALQTLRSSLLCPMCDQIMVDPSTLHCAHSFCLTCISNSDSWQCPGTKRMRPPNLNARNQTLLHQHKSPTIQRRHITRGNHQFDRFHEGRLVEAFQYLRRHWDG